MVDQLTLQTIGILLTGLTVSIAAIYYTLTLRYTRKNQEMSLKAQEQALETRQAQLIMNLSDTYRDKEFRRQFYRFVFQQEWEDFEDWWSKFDPRKNVDTIADTGALMGFYEGIGFLVKKDLIDIEYVDDLFGPGMSMIWGKYKPLLYDSRDFLGVHIYPNLEYLADELEKKEHHAEKKT